MLTPRLNNGLAAHNQRKRLLPGNDAIKMMLDLSLHFSAGCFWADAHKKNQNRNANAQSTNCWKNKMADPDMREREHCVCAANEASDDERVN